MARLHCVLCLGLIASALFQPGATPAAVNANCIAPSHSNSVDGVVLINSTPCCTFGELVSRYDTNKNNVVVPVIMKLFR